MGRNGGLAEMGRNGGLAEMGRNGGLAEIGRTGRLAQGRRSSRLAELLATKGPSADEIMEMFDHNGDGEIGVEEFKDQLMAIAEEHDYEPSEDDKDMAMKMFRMADQNKS